MAIAIEFLAGWSDDERPIDSLHAQWADLQKEAPDAVNEILNGLLELAETLPGDRGISVSEALAELDARCAEIDARIDLLPLDTEVEIKTMDDLVRATDKEISQHAEELRPEDFS